MIRVCTATRSLGKSWISKHIFSDVEDPGKLIAV